MSECDFNKPEDFVAELKDVRKDQQKAGNELGAFITGKCIEHVNQLQARLDAVLNLPRYAPTGYSMRVDDKGEWVQWRGIQQAAQEKQE